MEKLFSRSLLVLLAVAMLACGGKDTEVKNDKPDTPVEDPKKKERVERGFHNYDKEFQTLAGSLDGVIRGIDMFASPDEIKKVEGMKREIVFEEVKEEMPSAVLAEETAEMLKYTLKMADTEDAVIEYQFAEGKLNAVKITVHVLSNEEFEAMEEDFILFFTQKHGAPTEIEGRKEVWKVKGSDTHEIDIIDKQEGDKYYLEIDIS